MDNIVRNIKYGYNSLYINTKYFLNMKLNYFNYGNVNDIFGLRYINPLEIRFKMIGGMEWKKRAIGNIVEGDWDKCIEIYDDYSLYKSLIERYINKKDWSDIDFYKNALSQLNETGDWNGCYTKCEVLNRFISIDKLYNDIRNNGYKTQYELKNGTKGEYGTFPKYLREITVNISRNGTYILDDGRHRLGLAKILKLQQISVCVLVVHSDYIKSKNIAKY